MIKLFLEKAIFKDVDRIKFYCEGTINVLFQSWSNLFKENVKLKKIQKEKKNTQKKI